MRNPLWENFYMTLPKNVEEGEQILFIGEYCKVKRVFHFEDGSVGFVVHYLGTLFPMIVPEKEYQQVYGE
jgi:hypothetical protein